MEERSDQHEKTFRLFMNLLLILIEHGAAFMHKIVTGLLLSLIMISLLAQGVMPTAAQDGETQEPIKVVTKEIEPFVFVDEEQVSGFSIDLWQALAAELGIDYENEIVTTVQEQLDAVETNQADVAIAAISITADRETRIDFSHRYFESGLGILTRS
ncbi:MAG: transporter substrate-binding domain-containing protein, partial [Anaerolineales bacterium]